MRTVKNVLKKLLPGRLIESYRRRRVYRAYVRTLRYEIYDRQKQFRIEELEGKILARRPDLTQRLMKELLQRMDVVMEGFHRQLEGVRARHGTEIRELQEEVERLRAAVDRLTEQLEPEAKRSTARSSFQGEGEARSAPAAVTQAAE
ncbi:MAG TPA: hypothetical protein VF660_09690 [Actinomycetota bacterium]|jgi:hypothetical protein